MYNRVIWHWTAGFWIPRADEMIDYHCVIGYHRGYNAILSKNTPFDLYTVLPHAWHDNTGAYGISLAGMRGANSGEWETPIRKMLKENTIRRQFDSHNYGSDAPIRWTQIELCAKTTAEFLHHFNLPCNEKTCYSHAESAYRFGYFGERWDLWLIEEKMRAMVNFYLKKEAK